METPIDALKEKLHFLKEMTKQTHPTFRKYDKHIPVYEKAIKTLTEAETSDKPALNIGNVIDSVCCDPNTCGKLKGLSVFYDPCKDCDKQTEL